MQHADVRDLLTSGQAAAVLHKSQRTITRWAKSGELQTLGRIAAGNGGIFVFDKDVVTQKALELALGRDHGNQLDLGLDKKAS